MVRTIILLLLSTISRLWQYINKPPAIVTPPLDETKPNLPVVETTEYILEKEISRIPQEGTDAYVLYLDMPTVRRGPHVQFGILNGIYYEWVGDHWMQLHGVVGILYKQPNAH